MKPARDEGESQPLLAAGRVHDSSWRIVAACTGFLADSYDLFTIDLVVLILQLEYGEELISTRAKALMVSTMLAGVVAGQVGFGLAADWLGRKWAFVATAGLTIVGALTCSLCYESQLLSLPLQMSLCRFLLGAGVGGEYPLSATVTAETSLEADRRGQAMALVVSMQGLGMLMSAMMAVLLLHLPLSLEAVWRLLLAFGAVPSLIAFSVRWSLHESAAFEHDKTREAKEGILHIQKAFKVLASSWHLLAGTSSTWLLMNMFSYSLGSFKTTILDSSIPTSISPVEEVHQHAIFAAITSCFAILGFMAGLLLVRFCDRFVMQFYGFIAIAGVFFAVCCQMAWSSTSSATGQVCALGFMFLFLNAGPNLTTYIIPAEIFPTCVRATSHGISAASGKIGAFLGTAAFPALQQSFGMRVVYGVCGVLSLGAAAVTFYLTPREVLYLERIDAPDA
mmetsp:Transcript_43794/g.81758  ORF Transcript_43794/g.81758 Transcript_43794/m.81758 type:complete len:451 (-) Transcript_43794:78-1430(-)